MDVTPVTLPRQNGQGAACPVDDTSWNNMPHTVDAHMAPAWARVT